MRQKRDKQGGMGKLEKEMGKMELTKWNERWDMSNRMREAE